MLNVQIFLSSRINEPMDLTLIHIRSCNAKMISNDNAYRFMIYFSIINYYFYNLPTLFVLILHVQIANSIRLKDLTCRQEEKWALTDALAH